jgi:hypothetical protein
MIDGLRVDIRTQNSLYKKQECEPPNCDVLSVQILFETVLKIGHI